MLIAPTTTGKAYRKVAKVILRQERPNMFPTFQEQIIEGSSYETIEVFTRASIGIRAALKELEHRFTELGAVLPEHERLEKAVLYGEDETRILKAVKTAIAGLCLTPSEVAGCIVYATIAAHDATVANKAYTTASEDELISWLPLELVGYTQFVTESAYAEELIKVFGVKAPGRMELKSAYRALQHHYTKEHGITGQPSLYYHLRTLDYPALPECVSSVIRTGRSRMDRIIDAVMDRGILQAQA